MLFESRSPLLPHKFQRFLVAEGLAHVVRIKGFVWLADDRTRRYSAHVSGRRRVEVRFDGEWGQPPVNQLVVIGRQPLDCGRVTCALTECTLEGDAHAGDGAPLHTTLTWASALLGAVTIAASDPRIEVLGLCGAMVPPAEDPGSLPALSCVSLLIRVVGTRLHGHSADQLHREHGVDVDALVVELVNRANSAPGGALLFPVPVTKSEAAHSTASVLRCVPEEDARKAAAVCDSAAAVTWGPCDDALAAKVAVCPDADPAAWWSAVGEAAEAVFNKHLARTAHCKCGF